MVTHSTHSLRSELNQTYQSNELTHN